MTMSSSSSSGNSVIGSFDLIASFDEEPFDGYGVSTRQPGLGFYLFVVVYTIVAFLAVPFVLKWTQTHQHHTIEEEEQHPQQHKQQMNNGNDEEAQGQNKKNNGSGSGSEKPPSSNEDVVAGEEQRRHPQQEPAEHAMPRRPSLTSSSRPRQPPKQKQFSHRQRQLSSSSSSVVSGGNRSTTSRRSALIQDFLDQSYPDQDPEFLFHLQGKGRQQHRRGGRGQGQGRGGDSPENEDVENSGGSGQEESQPAGEQQPQQEQVNNANTNTTTATATKKSDSRSGTDSKDPTETSSDVHSAATTTRLHSNIHHNRPSACGAGAGAGADGTNNNHATFHSSRPVDKRFSDLVLDVNSRRWKSRRPIGRVDVIQKAIANETNSVTSGRRRTTASFSAVAADASSARRRMASQNNGPGGSRKDVANGQQDNIRTIHRPASTSMSMRSMSKRRTMAQQQSQRGMSDVASSILSEQHHQLSNQPSIQVDISQLKRDQRQQQILQFQHQQQHHPAIAHRLQALQRQQNQRSTGMKGRSRGGGSQSSRRPSWWGGRSVVSQSNRSVMSSIVDDIAPEDAADANDPGRGNFFLQEDNIQYLQNVKYRNGNYQGFGVQAACLTTPVETLLRLAILDDDKWRVVRTSIPLSIGASSEALFRLISAVFISQYLGTDSMVAFLLVGLFVRLTSEELAGAIVDALSSFIQASIYSVKGNNDSTGMYNAGQYVQLACILQLVLQVPLLIVWAVVMEPIVYWFTSSTTTASVAQDYTYVVIVAYLVQALSRTLTCIFHICGHEHFESVIDMTSSMIQVTAISCVVALVDDVDLKTVGYIQVLVTIASAITKVVFPVMRGWMRPIRRGLLQNMAVVQNKAGLPLLLKTAFFLMCGAILEYGQWELLTIFVRFLGPAEVAAWVLIGALWDFMEAFTEGIGESAANQAAFLLSLGHAQLAKDLSFSALYWACFQSLLVTSALLMSGQYLAVLFSTDPTIQHLFNNTIAMIGAANFTMAFSQITWSLIGSQGRFRLGTVAVFFSRWFVVIPVAAISVFAFNLDLNALAGSLVVGYSTASSVLLLVLLKTDWVRLASIMQAMNAPPATLEDFEDSKLKDKNDAVDPVLGELDLDDFDDSSDSSEGFGF
mmetsp:Transcript_28198/g.68586  ORF Transcript_28198/g.68586 Transcript_28198/m.68586 type:complete len:1125 (-) Transcript_28198:3331-6705(-)